MLTFLNTAANSEVVDKIIAHVGTKVITEYDIRNLDPLKYNQILAIKDNEVRKMQLEGFTKAALDYLIDQEVVIIAAEKDGITVSDQEVEMALNDIMKSNNLTQKKLEDALHKEGTTLVKYKYKLKTDILNARVRSQVLLPKIVVTDRDIRAMADKKSDEYNLKDKYHLSIIITSDKSSIKKASKEIKSSSFEEVAKKYSIDRSAINSGSMGEMNADSLNKDMLKIIKKLEVGEVSKPFKLDNQWMICRVDKFISKYDFDEETKKKIVDEVSNELFQEVFKNWIEKNKSTIVVIRGDN